MGRFTIVSKNGQVQGLEFRTARGSSGNVIISTLALNKTSFYKEAAVRRSAEVYSL